MDEISTLKEELNKIDTVLEEYDTDIKLGEMLTRLKANPDFQAVIMNGYIDSEARKLFNILTDPTGATPYTVAQTNLRLEAISHFKGFVGTEDYPGTIMMNAITADSKIELNRAHRKEVTARFANNGEV